jgi:hypothetical protein
MAKKTKKAKGKKAKATAKAASKPRPRVAVLESNMTALRDDLEVIIAEGEDQQGTLTSAQLAKAKKAKRRLDDALEVVTCIQSQAPY